MKRFNIVNNGYDIDEVNRFIDIVIGRLERLNTENLAYAEKIDKLNSIIDANKTDSIKLEKTILAIQDSTDRIKENSKEEAKMIVNNARNNANAIVHEALLRAEKIESNSMNLVKNTNVYRERIKSLLAAQLKIIEEMDNLEDL